MCSSLSYFVLCLKSTKELLLTSLDVINDLVPAYYHVSVRQASPPAVNMYFHLGRSLLVLFSDKITLLVLLSAIVAPEVALHHHNCLENDLIGYVALDAEQKANSE
jgi:hypothetical protein